MATAGVINSDVNPSSKKVSSLTITNGLELQGEFINNGIETSKLNVGFRADRANQTIASGGGGVQVTNYDFVRYDPTGSFTTSSGIWNCPVSGLWLIDIKARFQADATGIRNLLVAGNAQNADYSVFSPNLLDITVPNSTAAEETWVNITAPMRVTRGQFVGPLSVFQNSGNPLALHLTFSATLLLRTA